MPAELISGFVEVGQARLFYEMTNRSGADPARAVVLVHSGVADRRMWDGQFEALAAEFPTLRYDLRAFGKSEPVEGEFSHTDDLKAVLDELGIRQAALIGCSKGGGIAIDFTLRFPERVWALVGVTTSAHGYEYDGDAAPPPIWNEITRSFEAGDLERTTELEIQLWVDGFAQPAGRVAEPVRAKMRAMNLIALQNEQAGVGKELPVDESAAGRLGEIKAPVLIVTGRLDSPFVIAANDWLEKHIPHARRRYFDSAHFPNLEFPHEFNQTVLQFLREADEHR